MKNIQNKKIKIFILSLITFTMMFILSINCFCYDLCGEDIWFEWSRFEFNNMSYGAVANTTFEDEKFNIYSYGRFNFNYETNLVDFLNYLDSSRFKKWIELGRGNDKLNSIEEGLPYEWADFYENNKEIMILKQDEYLYNNYYLKIKEFCNIPEDKRIRGAIFSFAMHFFVKEKLTDINASDDYIQLINACYDNNIEQYIKNLYDMLIDIYEDNELVKKRFKMEKFWCIECKETEFDSKVGELLIVDGESRNNKLIKELNEEANYFDEFLLNYKFYPYEVNEWWQTVRSSVSYKNEFNIDSGFMDFKTNTSHGINLDNYALLIKDEVALTKPDNGTNVYYIPQNTMEYSNLKFGINNVGQAGGSLACLSMAIDYFDNRNKENLILPSNIIDKIKENHNNDYNFYYDVQKKGVKTEMLYDICSWYNLNISEISSGSLLQSLNNGHLIIARVKNCEFTENGQFILLSGIKEKDGKQYIVVHDPNIYHVSLCFKLYSPEFFVENCEGSFMEVYR